MGAKYAFRCPACAYEAEVSGGDDVGMLVRTTTILCPECRELRDVVTSSEPWLEPPAAEPPPLLCPQSSAHRVRRWRHPGPCPRCGEPLRRGRLTLLWD